MDDTLGRDGTGGPDRAKMASDAMRLDHCNNNPYSCKWKYR